MAPQIASWEQLLWVSEEVDEDTGNFKYTMLAAVENDEIYYSQISQRKADISFQDMTNSLTQIADQEIYPQWPQETALTKAPDELSLSIFVKRPRLALYDIFFEHKVVHLLAKNLVEEAEAMEVVAQHPHPNIVGYHGCRVRRGYITGMVLDRHPVTLHDYLASGQAMADKQVFMASLQSAIDHLHHLGWAHNDLNPTNILVAEDERPILIDFGSARKVGDKLSVSRGTKGWIDGEMKDYTTSTTQHDTSALAKINSLILKKGVGVQRPP
ncbi:hypothetical protein F66182_4854 [Fusarium sp. NRRL 66182]|nr:hypothetical protein F66182_4854 [Fusarium sp. NRRL 66182]